jgi:phage N-6-adenine-methyltransferase
MSARARARTAPPGSTDEWYTREKDFAPLHAEFNFTLDVCAANREAAKVPRFFRPPSYYAEGARAVDGLVQSWKGERVWCNPPYSPGNLARWVEKCAEEAQQAELIVALLPARTDRAWWHDHIEPGRRAGVAEVRFVRGRLRFGWPGAPDGNSTSSGREPSVLVVWRRERFRALGITPVVAP